MTANGAPQRMGAWPALAAVALLVLAGCASAPAKQDDDPLAGRTESRIVEGEEVPVAGAGAIRGRISDDAGLAVAQAAVSLIGTPYSTSTDVNGSFGFANVTPGELTLRVVSGPYRVHEGKVSVVADRVTEVNITLLPTDDRGPGYRPHVHDYWGANTQRDIMDDDLDWSAYGVYAQNYGAAGRAINSYVWPSTNTNWWMYFTIPDQGNGMPPIVLPGTQTLTFTLSWGAGVSVDSFSLQYTTANTSNYVSVGGPMLNGQSRTIELGSTDSDNGHQMFSLWQFRMQPTPRTTPMTIDGPIHLKMTATKGPLRAEPGHEDFWNGSTVYVARSYATPWAYTGATIGGCGEYSLMTSLDQGRLMPPGTNRMTLRFTWWSTDSQVNGTAADGTFQLRWKPANLPPGAPISQYVSPPPKSTGTRYAEWDLPVQAAETDAFYQTKSNWIFNVDRTDIPDDDKTCAMSSEAHHAWRLEVIAYKGPDEA